MVETIVSGDPRQKLFENRSNRSRKRRLQLILVYINTERKIETELTLFKSLLSIHLEMLKYKSESLVLQGKHKWARRATEKKYQRKLEKNNPKQLNQETTTEEKISILRISQDFSSNLYLFVCRLYLLCIASWIYMNIKFFKELII